MKKYLIAISAALAILLAGCGEGSSQDIDNKPNNIDVQENPTVEEQPVVETPKEQKVEEKDKESVTSSLKIEDYYPIKEKRDIFTKEREMNMHHMMLYIDYALRREKLNKELIMAVQ